MSVEVNALKKCSLLGRIQHTNTQERTFVITFLKIDLKNLLFWTTSNFHSNHTFYVEEKQFESNNVLTKIQMDAHFQVRGEKTVVCSLFCKIAMRIETNFNINRTHPNSHRLSTDLRWADGGMKEISFFSSISVQRKWLILTVDVQKW